MNRIGRRTLICMAAIVLAALVVALIKHALRCVDNQGSIRIGHMLIAGCE